MAQNKYMDIYNYIKEKISNNEYLPGDKIPSETEFTKIFTVSRNTVRKAIEVLSLEGILSSSHGKGVFVLDKPLLSFQLGGVQTFKEAILEKKLNFNTTIPIFEKIVIDKKLHSITGFPIGKEVFHLIRIRELDGEKVILDDNFFLKEYAEGLDIEIAMDSIYNFLENHKKIKINGSQKVISVITVSSLDKKYLDLKNSKLVAVVKNYTYTSDGIQFEYTESRHRPDKFNFITFAKR